MSYLSLCVIMINLGNLREQIFPRTAHWVRPYFSGRRSHCIRIFTFTMRIINKQDHFSVSCTEFWAQAAAVRSI